MDLATYDAFVFDAYGTIFDTAAPVMAARAKLKDPAALAQLWRRKQLEYTWQRSLMGRYVDFWRVTAEALDHALAVHKINDPSLRALMLQQYLSLAADPEAAALLGALRAAGKRTAILSNGSPTMLTAAVSGANLARLFDAVLSVDAIGIFKPHPSVYQLAVDKLATPAAKVLFVSANYWDAAGAASFGFHPVWINRDGGPRDPLPGPIAAEVSSLGAVGALFNLKTA